ncbi:hypothetical protein [Hymenobacter crusticola]|uniref:DUF4177 domain-containing protein n=1 Tax=Hymenobacter crusticola TaxID=1770526 RepID=A0A243W509_9BACT|nr:hypothetical protein [Hymenobacter crusticola]OUJ67691.1 hypothetical protein BXP70_28705 [Hymenobacter crusticola]
MKKLFVVASCLVVLGCESAWAQQAPEVVAVTLERHGWQGLFVITARGGGPAERQEIKFQLKDDEKKRVAEEYQKLVAAYYQQGYVLQGILPENLPSKGSSDGYATSTLLFIKPPKS